MTRNEHRGLGEGRQLLQLLTLLTALISSTHTAFLEKPSNASVLVGQDVTFRCSAVKDTTNYELYSQWRINTGALLGFHDTGKLAGHQGRYSYIKDSPDELHLRIEKVSLEDDGLFECQMLRPGEGPFRAAASLDVIVPPKSVSFTNYRAGRTIEINEDSLLNITCVSPNTKPEPTLFWYISGQRITDDIEHFVSYNLNKTSTSYASLLWKPRREDQGKVFTCEANHPKSSSSPLSANVTLNVLYPSEKPVVSIMSGEAYVKSGENVTLLCVAQGGNPAPNLTWFLKGRPIDTLYDYDMNTQETRNTYSFIAENTDHMMTYECRSMNGEGAKPISNSIHVQVAFAPQGVDIHGDLTMKQGAVTSIQCRSRPSNPPARISWLVNGHPVPSGVQSEHGHATGTVSISNLTINSNDVVTGKHVIVVECNARNGEGTASRQHIIKILSPPMAPRLSGLEDSMHSEGEKINITCEVHGGNPLADISWFKGYERMSGARSSVSGDSVISVVSLNLDRSMNNQRIKCEAMNSALDEPLQDSRQISVLYPPRRVSIRTPEGSRHQLIAGKESKLLCTAPNSNPPAELHWEFHPNGESMPLVLKGQTILNETTRENGHTVENVISFTPTDKYDGTLVRCIASHPLWPQSRNVTLPLNIYYAPRLLADSPISIVVSEGDSFRENLTVHANPPVSSWRWRKNGVPFDQTVGSIFARGAMLSGRSVKESDAGSYTLYAVNNVGTANVTFQVTVEYPAKISHITSPVVASAGVDVALECHVDGVPKKVDMVKWMRKGHEVASEKRGDTRAILRLKATHEQAGKYVCVAYNGIGEKVESSAYLLVNRAPEIVHVPALSRAAGPLGGKARLRCRAYAVPDAEFAWLRGEEQIRGNNSKFAMHTHQLDHSTFESTLWVSNLGPEDYAREVKCTAFNRLGEDSYVVPVGPLSPPELPLNLHSPNSTSDTIALSWTPGFDGGSDQSFEVRYQRASDNQMFAVNTTHSHVRLVSLLPASTYLFQVRAHNMRGFSSDFTRPALRFSTLTEDGIDFANVAHRSQNLSPPLFSILLASVAFLFVCNCVLLLMYTRRNRRKKIQEKTQIVRSSQNGDSGVRPVQMYGALSAIDATGRPSSGLDAVRDENHAAGSDDDHSVRTMIEVNPNGYMQQIDPAFYERNCLVDYEFDPRGFPSREGTLRSGTYANMPYPEPPRDSGSIYSERSLSRRSYLPVNSYNGLPTANNNNNNNNMSNNNSGGSIGPPMPASSQHMLSTFIQPNGVRAGLLRYSQLDGDLV